jgi:hypothetical protein
MYSAPVMPRHLAECTTYKTDGFNSIRDIGILTCYGHQISVPYHTGTGLPIFSMVAGMKSYSDFCAALTIPTSNETSESNHLSSSPSRLKQNLTNQQCIKVLLHERCNHRNTKTNNHRICSGYLNVDPAITNSQDPIFIACQYGKAHQKQHASDKGSITKDHVKPSDGVSADQMEANYPGKLLTTKGLPTHKHYKYCNLWVDHYSRYIFPTFHETKDAKEMIQSKLDFQTFAARQNIKTKSIRADNGVYASTIFQADCAENQQELTFCAVGGHWQNGVAERHIGVVTQTARTILLHAMADRSGIITKEFWPFAVCHACTFHNALIRADLGKSPHHLFTGSVAPWKLEDFHVFGSPVFVLIKSFRMVIL